MKIRSIIYLLIGAVLAAVLIGSATAVASEGKDWPAMMAAQRQTPLLWIVDGCGVLFLLGSWLFGAVADAQPGKGGLGSQQVSLLIDRIADLEALSRDQDARIEALESAGNDWHDGFDAEAARLTEQAFLALSDGIEANAQQLENITMALRYQRSEMKALRSSLKQGVLLPEAGTPPSLESVPRPPRAVTPRTAQQAEAAETAPAPETEPEIAADAVPVAEPATEADAEAEDTVEAVSAAAATASIEFDVDQIQRDRESAEVRAASVAEEFNSGKSTGRTVFRRQRNK
jgi:hypothetical protein